MGGAHYGLEHVKCNNNLDRGRSIPKSEPRYTILILLVSRR